jgi:hypothetical protein
MKLDKDILIKDFTRFSSEWIDTVEYNSSVYDYFEKQVDDHDSLLNHTEIVASID